MAFILILLSKQSISPLFYDAFSKSSKNNCRHFHGGGYTLSVGWRQFAVRLVDKKNFCSCNRISAFKQCLKDNDKPSRDAFRLQRPWRTAVSPFMRWGGKNLWPWELNFKFLGRSLRIFDAKSSTQEFLGGKEVEPQLSWVLGMAAKVNSCQFC